MLWLKSFEAARFGGIAIVMSDSGIQIFQMCLLTVRIIPPSRQSQIRHQAKPVWGFYSSHASKCRAFSQHPIHQHIRIPSFDCFGLASASDHGPHTHCYPFPVSPRS